VLWQTGFVAEVLTEKEEEKTQANTTKNKRTEGAKETGGAK